MAPLEPDFPKRTPERVGQPCSEACQCFQRLPGGGWSDYGLCTNPASPFHGFPVPVGQECTVYRPSVARPQPAQS